MSAFGGLIFTNVGRNLQAKAQAGAQLTFTRIAVGDGDLGGSSIADLTALKHQVKSLSITKLKTLTGGKAVVGTVFSNQDIVSGFYWRELGVFAQDPDLGEILYCYGNAGVNAEYIPATGGPDILEKSIDCVTIVGNASSVSATIESSLVYVTTQDFIDHTDNTVIHVTQGARDGWDAKETPAGAQAKVDAAITALLNGAPGALDTLNELSTALGNDANFAATITNALATKLNTSAYTANDVLTKVKTLDGLGSGLDSDTVRGITFRLNSGVLQYSTDSGGTWNNVGGVKSVQRGVSTVTALWNSGSPTNNLPLDVAISAVSSTSKASINLNTLIDGRPDLVLLSAALTSTTNLQITGSLAQVSDMVPSVSFSISWEVIEYY